MVTRICCVAFAIALAAGIGQARGQTLEVARDQFQQGNMSAAIRAAERALNRPGYVPTITQAYDLRMLKAEALLQTKRGGLAREQFIAAFHIAPDLSASAQANANALLISASTNLAYRPRSTIGSPIDIVNPDSRKLAMQVFANDLTGKVQRRYQAAIAATTLPPLEDAFQQAFDLYSLQSAGGLDTSDSEQILRHLADRAYGMLNNEIDRVRRRTLVIERISNTHEAWQGWGSRRGLRTPERNTLRDDAAYIERIHNRLLLYAQVARRFDVRTDAWDRLADDAARLRSTIIDLAAYGY